MTIKDKLLQESKTLKDPIELDGLFEGVELSDEAKDKFSTVFESAVKKRAVSLAETHVNELIENADAYLEEAKEEIKEEQAGRIDEYLSYLSESWLEENQLAVENGLKANMFDSLVEGMKDLFVEHNVIVPEESVNVVEELENELAENEVELNNSVSKISALKEELESIKRSSLVSKATADLTESQKEKVLEFAENLTLDEKFESKLSHIVDMVSEANEEDDEDDKKDKKDKKSNGDEDDKKDKKEPIKESGESGLNYNKSEEPSEGLTEEQIKRRQASKSALNIV